VIKHFEKVRWGKDIKCPYCKKKDVSGHDAEHRRKCYDCSKTFSVTVGTELHRTRVPLKTWLFAFSVITDAKKGVSALQLQRNLSVSYPTAFLMYRKIRELMAWETNQPDQLEGIVEMDEAYIGGKPRKPNSKWGSHPTLKKYNPKLDKRIAELKEEGVNFKRLKGNPAKIAVNPKRGRGTDNIPVVGIVQRNGDVVAEVMKYTTYNNLKDMVKKYVDEDNATLITDENKSYNKMNQIIEHIQIEHQKFYSYKGVNTNSIESFWAIIKRGIMGQFHHVTPKHLPEYIAEFVFKYNNRNKDTMFQTLVANSMNTSFTP
jgi:transposase-like protein